MRIERDVEGNMQIRELTLICADTLHRLPEYLESEDPAVRKRLLPQAYDDEDDEEQWRKFGASELEHLFVSHIEIVRKDLAGMQGEGRGPSVSISGDGDDEVRIVHATYRLSIPARHKAAWLSALNGGSHSIFIQHGLAPDDMGREPGSLLPFDELREIVGFPEYDLERQRYGS